MPTDLKGEQTSPVFYRLGNGNREGLVSLPKARSKATAQLGAGRRCPGSGRYRVVLHSVHAFLFIHTQVREERQPPSSQHASYTLFIR